MNTHDISIIDFAKELISSLMDREEVLMKLLTRLIHDFNVERGSVWSVEGDYIIPLFSLNYDGVEDEISKAIHNLRIPLGEGYVGRAAISGEPNFQNTPQADPSHFQKVDQETHHTTKSIISIPLNREHKTIGVIQLLDRINDVPFTTDDQERLMQHYAPWATIALDNANLYVELAGLAEDMVHSMGNVLGNARTKLYFLENDLKNFVGSIKESLDTFDKSVANSIDSVDGGLSQSIKLIRAHLEAYRGGKKETVQPKDLVNEALKQLALKRNIDIYNDVPDNLPNIWAIPQTMVVHFLELLTNATKAIEDRMANGDIHKGHIIITGKLGNQNVLELRFTNNGVNIHESFWETIFEKHKSMRKTEGDRGFGLGLWGARKFFERHGGSIKVEESVLELTTFLVTLPL